QKTTGNTARDSQGRTRNDAALPMIGNMSPAGAPHLVFINDPVAQASYTLNLDEKTAHNGGKILLDTGSAGPVTTGEAKWFARTSSLSATLPPPPPPMGPMSVTISAQKVD